MTPVGKILRREIEPDGPGAAVLVVEPGGAVHQHGYSLADVANGVQVTPRTVFDLASVSKQFTAVATLILAERGALALDDDIRLFLPELPAYDPRRPIRLNDLLRHTSGLPDYSAVWRGAAKEKRLTNDRFLGRLAGHPLDFATGSRAEYSNSNYVLLAVVIGRVSGQPFARFMHEEVFGPLGMKDSVIHDRPGLPIPRRARGYKRTKSGKVRPSDIPIVLTGHSHQFSSLRDMARWEAALRGHALVKPETLALAFTPGTLHDDEGHSYGLGWYEEQVGGRPAWVHSGGWYGFSSYACRFLAEGLAVTVLSNDESLGVVTLGERVAERFLPGGRAGR
jgi:CubicO group peptidase (beta-lactamase class C family)